MLCKVKALWLWWHYTLYLQLHPLPTHFFWWQKITFLAKDDLGLTQILNEILYFDSSTSSRVVANQTLNALNVMHALIILGYTHMRTHSQTNWECYHYSATTFNTDLVIKWLSLLQLLSYIQVSEYWVFFQHMKMTV